MTCIKTAFTHVFQKFGLLAVFGKTYTCIDIERFIFAVTTVYFSYMNPY
ncbi:hypothetical protein [Methanobrevibacter sp.]